MTTPRTTVNRRIVRNPAEKLKGSIYSKILRCGEEGERGSWEVKLREELAYCLQRKVYVGGGCVWYEVITERGTFWLLEMEHCKLVNFVIHNHNSHLI